MGKRGGEGFEGGEITAGVGGVRGIGRGVEDGSVVRVRGAVE